MVILINSARELQSFTIGGRLLGFRVDSLQTLDSSTVGNGKSYRTSAIIQNAAHISALSGNEFMLLPPCFR